MTEEEIIQCVKDSLNRQKLFIDLECVKFLEKENKQLKAQIEKMIQDVSDMKYFTYFGTVTNACEELLRKWELAE